MLIANSEVFPDASVAVAEMNLAEVSAPLRLAV